MIGLIGAMEEEVRDLREAMTGVRTEEHAGLTFYLGKLSGADCAVVCSGIGKVNAAAAAGLMCDRYQVSALFNTGIAGSLRPEIGIGDVILSTDAVQYDVDCTGFGYPAAVIPRMETSIFPADGKLLSLAERVSRTVLPDVPVHTGRIASGDVFVSSPERKAEILAISGGSCCEMEGAAIAHTAYLYKVPWLVIRTVSDQADGTAAEQYDRFQEKAISNFVALTKAMLAELNS